jgi:uncharacterized protein YndB with AHSA1/START domain
MDEVFRALADPSRRRLLDSLNAHNGQSLRELCAGLDMARQSVSKHLAVLEAANLVTIRWQGREKLHYLNAVPINAISERWLNQYDRTRTRALADLKKALEQDAMSDDKFVYTTYIKTTPERLWQALTEPAFTRQYWGPEFTSDWTAGAPMVWSQNGIDIADPEQVVLEADPFRRLAYTWHSLNADAGKAFGADPELFAQVAHESRTRVSFELAPAGAMVRLTVVHEGFDPGSTILEGVSGGWPAIIAALKTLLETGENVPVEMP